MTKDPHEQLKDMDFSSYGGEWIAILNSEVIAHSEHFDDVFYEAKKKCSTGEQPHFLMVPGQEKWIF